MSGLLSSKRHSERKTGKPETSGGPRRKNNRRSFVAPLLGMTVWWGLKPGLLSGGGDAGLKARSFLAARGRKQNRLGWREDWSFPHLAKPGRYGAPGSGQPVLRWALGEISRAGHHAPGDHCAGQGEGCADHHHDAKSKDKPLPNGSGYGGHGGRIETGRRLKIGEPVLLRADLLQRGRWQGEL